MMTMDEAEGIPSRDQFTHEITHTLAHIIRESVYTISMRCDKVLFNAKESPIVQINSIALAYNAAIREARERTS